MNKNTSIKHFLINSSIYPACIYHSDQLQQLFKCYSVTSESGYSGLMTMWMVERDPEDADNPKWRKVSVSNRMASLSGYFKTSPGPMTGKATEQKRCCTQRSKHLFRPLLRAYKTKVRHFLNVFISYSCFAHGNTDQSFMKTTTFFFIKQVLLCCTLISQMLEGG